MLTAEDLKEIGQYINRKMEKATAKIQNERNAKIVNYKIRAFIENIRDKMKRFEPVTLVDHQQTVVNKASQLDRIEITIGQVLNTVQGIAKGRPVAVEMKGMDESQSQTSVGPDLELEQVPNR